jgi:hypothetical protein
MPVCYLSIDWRICSSFEPNHKSWENPDIKTKLGVNQIWDLVLPRSA